MGCDYIAMGHYARVVHDGDKHHLLKGIDNNKDQTYFLCQLSKEQISKALFPIGELTKPEVRQLAIDYNLNVAKKKDSTGVCFIGERNFKPFLKNYILSKPGEMRTLDGQVVGKHDGIMYYTIGQRHGLGIGGPGEAWFVIGKIASENVLLVGQGDSQDYLYSNKCLIDRINIIEDDVRELLDKGEEVKLWAKFRYRQADVEVIIKKYDDQYLEVRYPSKVRAVTPGQECAIYNGDIVVGGGRICFVYMDDELRKY